MGAVDNNDRDIPKLNLVYISPCLGPLAILLGGIVSDVRNVPYYGKTWRTFECRQSLLSSDKLVAKNIDDRHKEKRKQR